MNPNRSASRRTLAPVLITLGALPIALSATGGCQTQQVAAVNRALERSGRVSFVCLAAPTELPTVALPLEKCTTTKYESTTDFGIVDDKTTHPHLYGLVTQTTRGEVAVIDLSTKVGPIIDANPRIPGASFLPIGGQPVDILTTPGGSATFVAVAEVGREGIFALPSEDLRLCEDCEPKTFTEWPACGLPAAPGRIALFYDKLEGDTTRASCDDPYKPIGPKGTPAEEKGVVDLLQEGKGRPKLAVTIPDMGVLAIIDAQKLFDIQRDENGKPIRDENGNTISVDFPNGSWNACPIDRWYPLSGDTPPVSPTPPPPQGPACVNPPPQKPASAISKTPRPSGIATTKDKLYIGDLSAPLIHVVDLKDPCAPLEMEPLLPSSVEDPTRIVTTTQLTATPTLATSLNQWLYAIDEKGGSIMVFDISEAATSRTPIRRQHPEWTPSQAVDRVDFGVPVQDIIIVERDNPKAIPGTGVQTEGIRCSPDPNLTVCTQTSVNCDPETLYRTTSDYSQGAGPTRLRGAFAYAVLGTGQIAIVDIDDYDAACRGPKNYTSLYGCPPVGFDPNIDPTQTLVSTGEVSCNVVVPHTPRGANFFMTGDRTGPYQPGIQSFPVLYDNQGALQSNVDPDGILMRATIPAPLDPNEKIAPEDFTLAVAGSIRNIDRTNGLITSVDGIEHTLAMNLEDVRAQSVSQTFTIVYEGPLPGFSGKAGKLDFNETPGTFTDAGSRFCDQGILSQNAWKEILIAENTPGDLDEQSKNLADYVQITSSILPKGDPYWETEGVKNVCSYDTCNSIFGAAELPLPTRDIAIAEAYQDHLILGDPLGYIQDPANPDAPPKPVNPAAIECCFPTLVGFNIRVHNQWAVVGLSSGFIHHVIPTPAENAQNPDQVGACRNSCDPMLQRKNGRVRTAPHGTIVKDRDPYAFINPFFRMAITAPKAEKGPIARNTFLQFTTQGNYKPLVVSLATQTTEIQPQAITYLPNTAELALTDGSLEGLIMMGAGRLDITRQFY